MNKKKKGEEEEEEEEKEEPSLIQEYKQAEVDPDSNTESGLDLDLDLDGDSDLDGLDSIDDAIDTGKEQLSDNELKLFLWCAGIELNLWNYEANKRELSFSL